jgi:hypothetical protein
MIQVLVTWKSGKEDVIHLREGGALTFGSPHRQSLNQGKPAQRFKLWGIDVGVYGDEVPNIVLLNNNLTEGHVGFQEPPAKVPPPANREEEE